MSENSEIAATMSKQGRTVAGKRSAASLGHEHQHSSGRGAAKECGTPPNGWSRVAIRDIADSIQYGHTASAVERKEGPRFLRITDIQDGRVDWNTVPSCDIPSADIPKYLLSSGDLVFARTGATTGKSFLIADCPEAVFASYLIRVRVSAAVDSRYLSAFFQSPDYWRQIEGGKRGIGQPNVNGSVLGEIQFPIAPLPEQLRIVAEIEKQFTRLEAGVAALRRVQANLKRYRASVLKAACEGGLVPTEAELAKTGNRKAKFETGEALLARVLTERRKKWRDRGKYKEPAAPDVADLSHLPEGWVWARAEQLCEFITKGTTPSADKMFAGKGEVQFIKVYNLTFTGAINLEYKPVFISRSTHELELTRSEVRAGDILINIVGPPLGQVSIVPPSVGEANINQAIARFRAVLPECQKQLAQFLMTEHIIGWALQRAKTTAGQSNLTLELCRDLPIPLPPLAEQKRIVAEVERRLSVIEELEVAVSANLHRATRLRQSILQKAFAGELE